MPPFLGQGMCSGIRDARNLAFKLDLLLRDAADPSILDTYQSEREPHVRTVTETGMMLGRRHTLRDPAAAAERDRAMRQARDSATAPVKLLLPDLGPGLLSSRHSLGAGRLSAHGIVTSDGRQGLLDDVVGGGFCLLADPAAARALTADGLGKRLGDAGVRVVELVADGSEAGGAGPADSRSDASQVRRRRRYPGCGHRRDIPSVARGTGRRSGRGPPRFLRLRSGRRRGRDAGPRPRVARLDRPLAAVTGRRDRRQEPVGRATARRRAGHLATIPADRSTSAAHRPSSGASPRPRRRPRQRSASAAARRGRQTPARHLPGCVPVRSASRRSCAPCEGLRPGPVTAS